jgi:hypothetical protein
MAITTSGAETDGRGEYCLALPPGLYKVRGYARTRPPSASPSCKSCCRAATDFVPTFYPGQLNVEKGRTVSRIDIRLRRAQVYCVRGEVRDGSGALVKDAYLGLIMDDVGGSAGVITEAGRFLLTDLTPGAYTLTLMDRPQLGRIVARKAFRITNHGIRDLVITTPYGIASPPPRP